MSAHCLHELSARLEAAAKSNNQSEVDYLLPELFSL